MKVIAINGSPKKDGNTATALKLMADELTQEGIEVEIVHIGDQLIHGCISCGYCFTSQDSRCVFKNDCVNEVAQKMREADGIILGSPTYYAGISGTMKSFLDRVFFTSSDYFKYKVVSGVTAVRRAGGVDVVHQLNNYFNLSESIIAPSQYWLVGYGQSKGEVNRDEEGVQTLQKNARAMAYLLKVLALGKEKIPLPPEEDRKITNFIR